LLKILLINGQTSGLKEMLAVAADYNQMMKDIPLSELLASSDLASLHTAILNILASIKLKIRNTKYPVKRALQFFMTISTDFCEQIIQVFVGY
jgi:dynein heavy chain 1, cytosolic